MKPGREEREISLTRRDERLPQQSASLHNLLSARLLRFACLREGRTLSTYSCCPYSSFFLLNNWNKPSLGHSFSSGRGRANHFALAGRPSQGGWNQHGTVV